MIERADLAYVPLEVATSSEHYLDLRGRTDAGEFPGFSIHPFAMSEMLGLSSVELALNIIPRDNNSRESIKAPFNKGSFGPNIEGVWTGGCSNTTKFSLRKWHSDTLGRRYKERNIHLQGAVEGGFTRAVRFVWVRGAFGEGMPYEVSPPLPYMVDRRVYYGTTSLGGGTYWNEGLEYTTEGSAFKSAHYFGGAGVWAYLQCAR